MNGTALYRALIEAGASEERAMEAAEGDVHAREAATKTDIARLEASMERSLRALTFRLIGAVAAMQALLFAALRFTGSA